MKRRSLWSAWIARALVKVVLLGLPVACDQTNQPITMPYGRVTTGSDS